ncbi:MAG: HlyD family efflux transporter periplasmic adaptor subunit [Ilumatobacteraceae bacterium]|jgi:multidrug efflux pump subunit AcrA (membrane-fusion protein)|nr:HlyD family efflux transporter periplasmic adaptor subunit [Ilumatobacteraceae bacterium]
MNSRVKIVGGLVGAALLVSIAVFVVGSGGSDSSSELLITPRLVERRDLQDVLTVSGEVRRDETRKINSAVDGKVSYINVDDGETIEVGDAILALDGRASVAVNGEFSFYRRLSVGSVGPDVRQLEEILVAAGHDIARPDDLFTEETRRALAEWQQTRGYGGATPEGNETLTVGLLSNPSAYNVGRANTVAFTVTPAVPSTSGSGIHPRVALPVIGITVDKSRVNEGERVTYTVTASTAPASNLVIAIASGGEATEGDDPMDGDDYSEILGTVTLPAGQTSVSFTADIFVDNVIEDEEDLTVTLTEQFGTDPDYDVGPTNQTRTVIEANGSDLDPRLTVTASNQSVDEGGTVTFTVRTTVESNRDIDFEVSLSGTSTGDADYVLPDDDDYSIPAGARSTEIQIQARRDDAVEPDETLIFTLLADAPSGGRVAEYSLGDSVSSTVTIESPDLPEMTLLGGGTVAEGRSGSFRIVADSPVTEDTSVNYQIGGTTTNGTDFDVLTGTVIMRAGTASVSIPVNFINDDVVFEPSDMIVAEWPARVGSVEVDEGEFVLQGAVMLNLTEPQFTITMKVSPSDRAELVVGQAVSVDLTVGGQVLPGVISELDDSATVGPQGEETYEGTIEVQGEFSAVDGATVSIDVTLAEVTNALVVPVASVLRSADGDIVRIVNDQGTISRVPVVIGLIDGEWAEIKEGLKGDELVIVDVESGAPADEADGA